MTSTARMRPTSEREILVNLGNRYAVFGKSPGVPKPHRFHPEVDSVELPSLDDEPENTKARIAETLRVEGMTRISSASESDVELVDEEGNHVLVELKVRESDPKSGDYDRAGERLRAAGRSNGALELWHFNIERLKLVIMGMDPQHGPAINELSPLDVWERTAEGIYNRARVVQEVDDWIHRLAVLYDTVREWLSLSKPEFHYEQSRTVIMSESIMQQFALPDRELSILDVLEGDQVVMSFVPRGLWLFGSWGRVDFITPKKTFVLLALGGPGALQWHLVTNGPSQERLPFNAEALASVLGQL